MKHITMIFLGAAILALSACAQKAVEAEKAEAAITTSKEALEYYQKGNDTFYRIWLDGYKVSLDEAIPLYEKAVELDPDFALAYARLAQAHLRMYQSFSLDRTPERLAKAKSALDRALALDPDHPEVHLAHGYYYYHGFRDWESALEQAELGLKGQPDNSELVALVGIIKRRQGKWEEALAALKRAAELNPDHVDYADMVAASCIVMRNWDEAERYADRHIMLAPEVSYGYNRKINAFINSGDLEKARRVAEEALEKFGPDVLVSGRAFIELVARDYQKALEIYEASAGDQFVNKAFVHSLMGHTEQAQAYYDSARMTFEDQVQKNPDSPSGHWNLGLAYAGLGRGEDAVREGKLAVELLPLSKDASAGISGVYNLAGIYTMLGDADAALDQLEQLLSIPSQVTVWRLENNPGWDPLRKHPRYKELVAKYE